MALSIRASKKALRKHMKDILQAVPPFEITMQSELILKHILDWDLFKGCHSVSCYLSMAGEVDTGPIALQILRAGKSLFVPSIGEDACMRMLRVYNEEDLLSLPTGTWGIKEPNSHWGLTRREGVSGTDIPAIELILLPGVAFDTSFARLGHGKGYYDKYLTSYLAKVHELKLKRPTLVGLALLEQVMEPGRIPMADHDRRLEGLVTSKGLHAATSLLV